MRSLSAVAAVFMVTLFSPLALFAAEKPVTFRGQTIYVDGDPQPIWIGDKTSSDAELVRSDFVKFWIAASNDRCAVSERASMFAID